jgi:uncharacterized protein YbaP (TraB family)
MSKLRTGASAAILSFVLSVTACGTPSLDTDGVVDSSTSTEAASDAITASSETSPERPTRGYLLEQIELAIAQAETTQGTGSPALWTLADEDTTLYMFGTVHLLRPELEWRSDAFNEALISADKIVFELDTRSEAAQRAMMTEFLPRGMYTDGQTLTAALNDEDEAVIAAAFDSLGVPIAAMNTFEPWMASMNLGVMQMKKDGYDPQSGVETVIATEAEAAGKSFGYLETISQQADAFDLLPEADQISMLYESALILDETTRVLDVVVAEWADGDVKGIESLVASPDLSGQTPAAYENLFVVRNKAWVPQIETMLDEPGTVLIAVGAGHLAGPDSVIKMLRDKGYTIDGP